MQKRLNFKPSTKLPSVFFTKTLQVWKKAKNIGTIQLALVILTDKIVNSGGALTR